MEKPKIFIKTLDFNTQLNGLKEKIEIPINCNVITGVMIRAIGKNLFYHNTVVGYYSLIRERGSEKIISENPVIASNILRFNNFTKIQENVIGNDTLLLVYRNLINDGNYFNHKIKIYLTYLQND